MVGIERADVRAVLLDCDTGTVGIRLCRKQMNELSYLAQVSLKVPYSAG
jgi:hypothetical protein